VARVSASRLRELLRGCSKLGSPEFFEARFREYRMEDWHCPYNMGAAVPGCHHQELDRVRPPISCLSCGATPWFVTKVNRSIGLGASVFVATCGELFLPAAVDNAVDKKVIEGRFILLRVRSVSGIKQLMKFAAHRAAGSRS